MSMLKNSFLAALAVVSVSSQANANIVTTFSAGPQAGSSTETFDELALGTNSGTVALPAVDGHLTFNGNSAIVTGTLANQYAAPFGDTSKYLAVAANGSATFSLNRPANYFGFELGSVDSFNTLTFMDGSTVVGTITGSQIDAAAGLANGSQGANGTTYANFNSTSLFTSIIASSSNNSFEIDNVSISAVPLPASLPMFLAGLVGLTAFGLRRKTA